MKEVILIFILGSQSQVFFLLGTKLIKRYLIQCLYCVCRLALHPCGVLPMKPMLQHSFSSSFYPFVRLAVP